MNFYCEIILNLKSWMTHILMVISHNLVLIVYLSYRFSLFFLRLQSFFFLQNFHKKNIKKRRSMTRFKIYIVDICYMHNLNLPLHRIFMQNLFREKCSFITKSFFFFFETVTA